MLQLWNRWSQKIRSRKLLKKNDSKISNTEAKATVSKEDYYCFPTIKESLWNDNIIWYLYSGASEHLVTTDKYLENERLLEMKVKIRSAKSGQFLMAEKIGDVKIGTIVADHEIPISIKDVFVPGLELNLLSVWKLEMNGLKIVFEGGKGQIIKGNQILVTALRNEKLYELQLSENSTLAWHDR